MINQVQTVPNYTAKGSNDMVQKLASRIYRLMNGVVPPFHSALHCFEECEEALQHLKR
ncbi:hypothetical protein A2U01_0096083, partial [Trifolium medium]|nr:hypothetical protein [Trifolium medium]